MRWPACWACCWSCSIIVGVLAAVFVAGVVTVVAQALELDVEWILAVVGALATLAIATGIVYGIYRVIPANPPTTRSARLPAILVGVAIAVMTLLYSIISPWLVSGFQAFGVMASVFVALVWLRVVFLAMVYGAAMARYRDFVAAAEALGEAKPDAFATHYAIEQEEERAQTRARRRARHRTSPGTGCRSHQCDGRAGGHRRRSARGAIRRRRLTHLARPRPGDRRQPVSDARRGRLRAAGAPEPGWRRT